MSVLLEVENLKTYFKTDAGILKSVDGISFTVGDGEMVGVVGESGCGKSVTALSILRLVPSPPGFVAGGSIRYRGENLLELPASSMRKIRGNEISMIFQEPMTSLNPVYTVGDQIEEAILLHQTNDPDEARAHAIQMLTEVGIPSPQMRMSAYPHQLSGGMKQRVMIAIALSCQPDVLIADEPTTALDVTIQAQILDLLVTLQRERGMAVLLITHDLGVVAETCQRMVVMYAGHVAETGTTHEVFANPRHPYTQGLLDALPERARPGETLRTIDGNVPSPQDFPTGCRFRTRCPLADQACQELPPQHVYSPTHRVTCHHPVGGPGGLDQ